jgi:hypothetical protein
MKCTRAVIGFYERWIIVNEYDKAFHFALLKYILNAFGVLKVFGVFRIEILHGFEGFNHNFGPMLGAGGRSSKPERSEGFDCLLPPT